jgi:membrane protein implicated in regulation of membrane protease activity/DNA-binding XRE family transcriptional regulator
MVWWLWGLLGLLALAGESVSMALFLLNVGIAAFVAALLSYLGLQPAIQVGAFVVLSALLVTLVRPRMLHVLLGRRPPALPTAGSLVDRIATVTDAVTAEGGMIRVGKAEFWTARPSGLVEAIEPGQRVRIARVDGLTAYVEPVAAPESAARPEPSGDSNGAVSMGENDAHRGEGPTFGELLRRHRLAAGLTQEALAERARLSVRAISDLERGLHRNPQRDTAHLLADALQLSPQDRAAFEAAARRLATETPRPSR